jgi:hypothetical protein
MLHLQACYLTRRGLQSPSYGTPLFETKTCLAYERFILYCCYYITCQIRNQLPGFIPTGARSDTLTRYPGFTRQSSQEKVPFEQIGHLT